MNNLARHGVIASSRGSGSTLKDGLISYWALDEASGTRADSHTANSFDLTDVNTVLSGTGAVYATCADMERTNSEGLTHADNDAFSPSSLTITAWVKFESFPGGANITSIFSKDDYALTATREWNLYYSDSDNKLKFIVFYGSSFFSADTAANSLSLATWYFLVARHDQGTGVNLSIDNGTPITSAGNHTMNSSTAPLAVGGIHNGGVLAPAFGFDGLIGPVSMYNRSITDSEVTLLHNSGTGLKYSEL